MKSQVQIVEKPDWVPWEEVRQCLIDAHSVNRDKGIKMIRYQSSGDQIRDLIGKNGKMFVALDGERVVATAAFIERIGKAWYCKGPYVEMCLAGVLPEYSGKGLHKEMTRIREDIAEANGFHVFVLSTHEKNKRIRDLSARGGYIPVKCIRVGDHSNIVMVKWLDGNPYPLHYCHLRLALSYLWSRLSLCFHSLMR